MKVRVAPDGDAAVLVVADTGAGIPANLCDKVFDLFVQGDRARPGAGRARDRAHAREGAGRAARRHGGGQERGTGPGQRVHGPPAERGRRAARQSATSLTQVDRPLRILVIDDNDDAREMLRVALTLAGHTVCEAADGRTAIDVAIDVVPDVALVDIGLPGLDGYEVARQIRAEPRAKSVSLVAVTGYGQAEDQLRALDAGFDAHLTKPVWPERLAAAIAETMARRVSC